MNVSCLQAGPVSLPCATGRVGLVYLLSLSAEPWCLRGEQWGGEETPNSMSLLYLTYHIPWAPGAELWYPHLSHHLGEHLQLSRGRVGSFVQHAHFLYCGQITVLEVRLLPECVSSGF